MCLVVLFAGAAWGQWEPFRGPNGTGVSDSPGVPVEFGTAKNMMCHYAILDASGDGEATTWLEPVTDEQYLAAHRTAGV